MVFHNDFARIVNGIPNSSKLDQDFTAVLAALNHTLDRFQMPYGTGEAVDHRAHLLFGMYMAVMNMPAGMRVRMFCCSIMGMRMTLFLHRLCCAIMYSCLVLSMSDCSHYAFLSNTNLPKFPGFI